MIERTPPRKPTSSPYAYAYCKFGDHIIQLQDGPDNTWGDTTSIVGGFLNFECPDAPNPEDGPMPGHEPRTVIVNPNWKDPVP